MSRATSATSDNGWAALISKQMIANGRPPGDGWKTVSELIPIMGRARQTLRPMLVKLAKAGDVEQAEGTNELGQVCTFFRPTARAVQHSAKLQRAR